MSKKKLITRDSDCDYFASRIILFLLKFIGLAPFGTRRFASREPRKKCAWQNFPSVHFSTSRFGCGYNMCLVPLQVVMLWFVIPMASKEEYSNKTSTTLAFDMISCALGYVALFVIWLTLGFKQKTTVRLLNRLMSFDCATSSSKASHATARKNRSFGFYFTCVIYIVITTGALYTEQMAFGFLFLTYVLTGVPSIIISWFIAQYAFVVKLIGYRYEAMNQTLLDCNVPSPLGTTHRPFVVRDLNSKSISEPNFAYLRRAHMNISRISSETADFYSIPILLSVTRQFYELICNGHYLVVNLVGNKKKMPTIDIVAMIFWMSITIVPVVILAAGVTNVTKEATVLLFSTRPFSYQESRKTCDAVKKLLTHSNNSRDANIELERFLLQLLHQDLRFTACGLFSLDLTLVHSIIRTIVTYTVILFQFQLRAKRAE